MGLREREREKQVKRGVCGELSESTKGGNRKSNNKCNNECKSWAAVAS
jgi:hypothetical protein